GSPEALRRLPSAAGAAMTDRRWRPWLTTRLGARVLLFLAVGVVALPRCSAPSDSPLGGPYGGGSEFRLGPTDAGYLRYLNADATYTVPTPPLMPGQIPGTPGTWTHIFYGYLNKGTVGNCTKCHQKEMPDPPKSYKWLED